MNKKRRIAFIWKWPLSYNGGGENWLKNVISELCLHDNLVDVYIPDFYANQVKSEGCYKCVNYRYFHSPAGTIMHKFGLENFSWPLLGFKINIKYDVIYIPSIYAWRFFSESSHTKIIFGTHDFYHPNHKLSRDIVISIFIYALKRFKDKNIFVHCIDQNIKSQLSFLGDKAILIENFPYSSYEPPKDYKSFTVLFMNVLNRRKGLKYLPALMDYFRDAPDARFLIAGKAEEKVAKLIKEKENKNAKYLGYVSDEVKRNLMQTTTLFLLISDREAGNPFSLLDSLAAGIPVLSTWKPLHNVMDREFFNMNAVSIRERNIKGIENGIYKYLKLWEVNKAEYLTMRNEIQEYTKIRFNKDKQLNKILEMFEEI